MNMVNTRRTRSWLSMGRGRLRCEVNNLARMQSLNKSRELVPMLNLANGKSDSWNTTFLEM